MSTVGQAQPLDDVEFAVLMRSFAPFESNPEIAVAVSGGRDSMALLLLGDAWARACGGTATALTVDHGLRSASAAEARRVAGWCRTRGIKHQTLAWRGTKPTAGVQDAARSVRYDLMQAWCRRRGVLHLLLAHQRDDQAETILMRMARHSGLDGLAAMSACRLQGGVRLLRPLLSTSRTRLAETLRRRRQAWIDDPSNEDAKFERVRVRRQLAALASNGISSGQFAAAARAAGLGRAAREREVAALTAAVAYPSAAGHCLVDVGPFVDAVTDIRRAVWRRLLMFVSGRPHPPRSHQLEQFLTAFDSDPPGLQRTLSGCRILPWRDRLLVARESRHPPQWLSIAPGDGVRWDRFQCKLKHRRSRHVADLKVCSLGSAGWRLVKTSISPSVLEWPAFVRHNVPALWDASGPIAVPHFGYRRPDSDVLHFSAEFSPIHSLTAEPFMVASELSAIM